MLKSGTPADCSDCLTVLHMNVKYTEVGTVSACYTCMFHPWKHGVTFPVY